MSDSPPLCNIPGQYDGEQDPDLPAPPRSDLQKGKRAQQLDEGGGEEGGSQTMKRNQRMLQGQDSARTNGRGSGLLGPIPVVPLTLLLLRTWARVANTGHELTSVHTVTSAPTDALEDVGCGHNSLVAPEVGRLGERIVCWSDIGTEQGRNEQRADC